MERKEIKTGMKRGAKRKTILNDTNVFAYIVITRKVHDFCLQQ
jgi:hypothetical protein